jgi:hypothetical protein
MGNIAEPFVKGVATIGTWFGIKKNSTGNLAKNLFGVTNEWSGKEKGKKEAVLAKQNAIPALDGDVAAAAARDRMRRLAGRANGIASTEKAGAAATLYTATPKSLLGG